METNSFDAIVVGTGMSGGWAAKELTEKGLKTLVLDRGRMVRHGEYPTATKDPWDLPYGNRITQETRRRKPVQSRTGYPTPANEHWFVDDLDNPYVEEPALRLAARLSRRRPLAHVGAAELSLQPAWISRPMRKEGVGIPWPVSYDEIAPWYDKVEIFAGISGSVEGLPQLPDGKFLPPHGSQLRRDGFQEAARRKARPQAHHRPLRQSHRAAHAQREPAARHLPVAQPVHPRLSVRRLLQQRLGDAAVGRTHRQHDAAAEPDRLRTHLRQRQGQAPPACACSMPKPASRPTTSPRSIFLCASALGSAYIMLNSRFEPLSERLRQRFGRARPQHHGSQQAGRFERQRSKVISTWRTPAAGRMASTFRVIATSARTSATTCAASATRAARRAQRLRPLQRQRADRRGAQEGGARAGSVEHRA